MNAPFKDTWTGHGRPQVFVYHGRNGEPSYHGVKVSSVEYRNGNVVLFDSRGYPLASFPTEAEFWAVLSDPAA